MNSIVNENRVPEDRVVNICKGQASFGEFAELGKGAHGYRYTERSVEYLLPEARCSGELRVRMEGMTIS